MRRSAEAKKLLACGDNPVPPPCRRSRGEVSFQDVVFGYNPANPILKVTGWALPGACAWAWPEPLGPRSSLLPLPLPPQPAPAAPITSVAS